MPYPQTWERKAKEEGIKEVVRWSKREEKTGLARRLLKTGIVLDTISEATCLSRLVIDALIMAH
jgi:hypothetical protein